MHKYAIGVDFGTLSARALVAEIGTGRELATATMDYPHGVLDEALPHGVPAETLPGGAKLPHGVPGETLPDGTKLPPDWALQHPQDYLDCLRQIVPEALAKSGIAAKDVVGLGIDFTACTLLSLDETGTPLCLLPAFAHNPHAYGKLWKHHAAQDEANRMTALARSRGETFLPRYGGKISSEWMFPKIWQTLNEAPEVYQAADRFIEAADWVVHYLTGSYTRSGCAAGYKAFWNKTDGYPSEDFFRALDPRLANVTEKLRDPVRPIGAKAGELRPEAAREMGLLPGTAVAVANVDAHVSFPPAGLTEPGDMLLILGTSTCVVTVSDKEVPVPGICGAVADGVIPGLIGYEAGQPCVGDLFRWFVERGVPMPYAEEARARDIDLYALLTEKAEALRPGESGLLALDWWNGNRSVLVDVDLTGLILGLTLASKPEEIYRALIESTAFGARTILETFEKSGLPVQRLYACGGIAQKNPFLMRLYADVLGREIRVARSAQTPALGSAMFGALAAGAARGGYDSIARAAREMGGVGEISYAPDPAHSAAYDRLYAEYTRLHDYFGRGGNEVMKRLKAIRESALSK